MDALPIGIENYRELTGKYYVDKTMLIKEIVEYNLHSSVLITRPRRFGKSLALSMMETFFSDEQDGHLYFQDKKYAKNGTNTKTFFQSTLCQKMWCFFLENEIVFRLPNTRIL